IFLMGAVMLGFAFQLYRKKDNVSARKLMLASVSYITLMQIVYVIDKFLA
ncbi:MAG TPA: protoheme IX farnesyltransferase, partial [Maribacter sp.]|nr:protoheme IX farnesyltransferase [Maribacter sp.]